MNLYKIVIIDNDCDYDVYTDFVVIGNNIKEVLDAIYFYVCKDVDENNRVYYKDIPYYLRSSNMRIDTIGEFKPSEIWDGNPIISYGYRNA